jgi:hypothetical protein
MRRPNFSRPSLFSFPALGFAPAKDCLGAWQFMRIAVA